MWESQEEQTTPILGRLVVWNMIFLTFPIIIPTDFHSIIFRGNHQLGMVEAPIKIKVTLGIPVVARRAVLGGFLVAELDRFRGVFRDFDSDASGDMCAGELGSASLGYCWGVFTSVYGRKWVKKHGKTSGKTNILLLFIDFLNHEIWGYLIFRTHDGPASSCFAALLLRLSSLGFPYTNDKVQSLYKESDMNGSSTG